MCKYIYLSMYIYLVEQCVQKIKEGTDKLKLMIEVKMTDIIPESYRCVLVKGGGEGEAGGLREEDELELGVVEEEGAVPPKEAHSPSNLREGGLG